MREVRQSLALSKSQIIQDFKLQNVVPLCLPNILQTLAKWKVFVPWQFILDKSFYEEPGIFSRMKGWVVRDNGPELSDEDQLVSVDFLNDICSKVEKFFEQRKGILMDEKSLWEEFNELKKEDFDIVIIHLTKKFMVDVFEDKSKTLIFRCCEGQFDKISEKEIASF